MMDGFRARLAADPEFKEYKKRVKGAFFSNLTYFTIFLIFAFFGLLVAYIAHMIVNIGVEKPESFKMPGWTKTAESYSVGLFVLALLTSAVAQPCKDVYNYFRYGSVEPKEELGETVKLNRDVRPLTHEAENVQPKFAAHPNPNSQNNKSMHGDLPTTRSKPSASKPPKRPPRRRR